MRASYVSERNDTTHSEGDKGTGGRRGAGRLAVGTALAATALLALTACGGGDSDSGSSAAKDTPTSSTQPSQDDNKQGDNKQDSDKQGSDAQDGGSQKTSTQGADTGSDAPEQDSDTARSDIGGRCSADALSAALSANGQEMNSRYFDLALTNTGKSACTLKGYPGLSLADSSGKRIGDPAERSQDGDASLAVHLAPGAAAHVTVKSPTKDVTDGKCWAKPDHLVVYAPGEKQSVQAANPDGFTVCGGSFQTGPVMDSKPQGN